RRVEVAGPVGGGERQMLASARALMARPRLLLLDEPSMGLAPVLVEQIFDTIGDINRQGMTILLVEQNAAMALSIAHRGYVLETGSIALAGTAAGVADNADVRRASRGEYRGGARVGAISRVGLARGLGRHRGRRRDPAPAPRRPARSRRRRVRVLRPAPARRRPAV